MSIDIPHLAAPTTFTSTGMGVVDQNSLEHLASQVYNVCVCPVGFRSDLPAFGIPWPQFTNAPPSTNAIADAIRRWVPHATIEVSAYQDAASNQD